jgi:hypothetical protein
MLNAAPMADVSQWVKSGSAKWIDPSGEPPYTSHIVNCPMAKAESWGTATRTAP